MSAALALRRAVEEAGGTLRASGGDLVVRMPAGRLDPALVAAIRAHKAEVLTLLEAEAEADRAYARDALRRAENCLTPEVLADEAELCVRGELG